MAYEDDHDIAFIALDTERLGETANDGTFTDVGDNETRYKVNVHRIDYDNDDVDGDDDCDDDCDNDYDNDDNDDNDDDDDIDSNGLNDSFMRYRDTSMMSDNFWMHKSHNVYIHPTTFCK